jgi:sec-independent protein translocase protein TatA
MLKNISLTEWLIIALIIILIFGSRRIPDFFKGLADALKEFKKASKGSDSSSEEKSSEHHDEQF